MEGRDRGRGRAGGGVEVRLSRAVGARGQDLGVRVGVRVSGPRPPGSRQLSLVAGHWSLDPDPRHKTLTTLSRRQGRCQEPVPGTPSNAQAWTVDSSLRVPGTDTRADWERAAKLRVSDPRNPSGVPAAGAGPSCPGGRRTCRDSARRSCGSVRWRRGSRRSVGTSRGR